MEYPRVYRAPKVENLASKVDVAWGECSIPGLTPAVGHCGTNGVTADTCKDVGNTAGTVCNYPGASAGP